MTKIEEMQKFFSSVVKWNFSKVRELQQMLNHIEPTESAEKHREYHDGLKLIADAMALC